MSEEMEKIDFLQSEEWRKFQESVGSRTFHVEHGGFSANIIEHKLPIAGSYFYIPRWPLARIFNFQFSIFNQTKNLNDQINKNLREIIDLAKKEKAGWIRIDLENNIILEIIRNTIAVIGNKLRIEKAPHNMQPKEIFVIDITKPEKQLLSEMKSKTRYNINLSQKRGVFVKEISNFQFPISNQIQNPNDKSYYIKSFIKLEKLTAERKKIKFHPEEYYRKMIETIPENMLKLYTAEYNNKVIAANLVAFYGNTATYLHGATDDGYRNVMAPYLLHWQVVKDAKKEGCERYDMGGVKTISPFLPTPSPIGRGWGEGDWSGVTKFKLGFSPNTKPVEFAGSYDIVVNPARYWVYKIIQRVKSFVK